MNERGPDTSVDPEELSVRIAYFVRRVWGEPRSGLTPSTRLVADLGLAGDDGSEFMAAYAKEFGVDLSGFPAPAVFGREGMWPWEPPLAVVAAPVRGAGWMLRRILGRMSQAPTRPQPDVTLRELVEWAARGSWVAPDPDSSQVR